MDTRFVQAHKEARWALGLTLLYLAVWLVAAYLPGVAPGFTGFPRWFEMAWHPDAATVYWTVLGDGEIYLSRYPTGG